MELSLSRIARPSCSTRHVQFVFRCVDVSFLSCRSSIRLTSLTTNAACRQTTCSYRCAMAFDLQTAQCGRESIYTCTPACFLQRPTNLANTKPGGVGVFNSSPVGQAGPKPLHTYTQAWKQASGDPSGVCWNYRGITLLYKFWTPCCIMVL